MVVQSKQYTVEEFEEIIADPANADRLLELIHGEIFEKVPTLTHGMIAVNISTALKLYAKQYGGRVAVEASHRAPGDKSNVRLPDVSYSNDTTTPIPAEGAYPHMPDVAVEIQSPHDSIRKMREKADFYLEKGVKLVWLVYPEKKLVEVYDPNGEVELLNIEDSISGGDVLPDFQMSVQEIFEL